MTKIIGETVNEETVVKKRKQYLSFLAREWWEVVHTEHLRNDIHIITDNPIRDVYLNGNKIN